MKAEIFPNKNSIIHHMFTALEAIELSGNLEKNIKKQTAIIVELSYKLLRQKWGNGNGNKVFTLNLS
jgi:hypothetical protein